MSGDYRGRTSGREAEHPGKPRGTSGVAVLAIAAPVRSDVAGVAHRYAMDLRRITEVVHYLEGPCLVALDAERVDRINDNDRRAGRQLTDDLEGDVEIASYLQHLRPVHER